MAKTWNGANADWETPADWGGSVPGSADTADINSGTVTIGASDPAITVDGIAIGGTGTLAVADPSIPLTVTGNLSNSAILDVDTTGTGGSSVSVGGTLSNTATGSLGVFIGNAGITQATSATVAGLTNSGPIPLMAVRPPQRRLCR